MLTAIRGQLSCNNFLEVMGIVNGTTNYILTKMTEEGASYDDVLKDAQEKGFAEKDPTADVDGIDAANKLSILIALLFGKYVAPMDIPRCGIRHITQLDIGEAEMKGEKIKLIAHAVLNPDGTELLGRRFLVGVLDSDEQNWQYPAVLFLDDETFLTAFFSVEKGVDIYKVRIPLENAE